MKNSKFQGLQVLRVFAAVLVLVTHSTLYVSERLAPGFPLWSQGARGVDVFFVISGFVMVCCYARLSDAPGGWRVFMSHRIRRIVPMYWLATTLKLAVLVATPGLVVHVQKSHLRLSSVLFSYLFIPTRTMPDKIEPLLGVGWTLNLEMFFYLLFACALLLRIDVFKFVGVVLSLVAIASLWREPYWPAISFYLNVRILGFFFGMLIAKAVISGVKLRPRFALPLLLAGATALLWPSHTGPHVFQVGIPAAAMIVLGAAFLEPYFVKLPKWLLFLADASYVTYLFHPLIAPAVPVIFALSHLANPRLSVLCSVCSCLLITSLIYRFVDAPISKRLRGASRIKPSSPMVLVS